MKMNWKKISLYVLCVVIAGFYLLVLWWGKNPDVCTEYRMYYITHELKDWPGYGNLSYEPGTLLYTVSLKDKNGNERNYKVCQTKGAGWEEEQYEGSVNKGGTSLIYFRPTKGSTSGVLKLQVSDCGTDLLTCVYVNEEKIGTFNKAGDYEFSFGGYEEDELITVKFVTEGGAFTLKTIQID